VLTFFSLRSWVGRSVMNSPSTTGTKTNVPVKPLALISMLAAWSAVMSASRRHFSVSEAVVHLRKKSVNYQHCERMHFTRLVRPSRYRSSNICERESIQIRSCYETYLWNSIVILVLRRQKRRARNSRPEQWWVCFPPIRHDLLED